MYTKDVDAPDAQAVQARPTDGAQSEAQQEAEAEQGAHAVDETQRKPMTTTEDMVREAIRQEVYDPEIGINIVDLGLVYDITVADNKADITFTLTTPFCPVGPELMTNIRRALARFEDIEEVDLHMVFSPPWHPSMMSEEAKDELGYFG
jgi:metal-sulfur cluster biosynthetic enzyme